MTKPDERRRKDGQNSSPGGSGPSNKGSEPEPQQDSEPDPQQEPEPQPEPEGFTDPLLVGKSPREIQTMMVAQRNQIHEYGQRLSSMDERLRRLDERTTPPEREVTPKDFYDNPVQTINEMMAAQLEPLKAQLQGAVHHVRGNEAEARLRQKYDDWDDVRPYIEAQLERMGPDVDRSDEGLLEHLYFASLGYKMKIEGAMPRAREPQQDRQPAPPPQHRSSSPPPPPSKGEQRPKVRELTENEKVLARSYGMTPEQYLEWQTPDYEEKEANIDFISGRSERDLGVEGY